MCVRAHVLYVCVRHSIHSWREEHIGPRLARLDDMHEIQDGKQHAEHMLLSHLITVIIVIIIIIKQNKQNQ